MYQAGPGRLPTAGMNGLNSEGPKTEGSTKGAKWPVSLNAISPQSGNEIGALSLKEKFGA
jgi:hypothetical protein